MAAGPGLGRRGGAEPVAPAIDVEGDVGLQRDVDGERTGRVGARDVTRGDLGGLGDRDEVGAALLHRHALVEQRRQVAHADRAVLGAAVRRPGAGVLRPQGRAPARRALPGGPAARDGRIERITSQEIFLANQGAIPRRDKPLYVRFGAAAPPAGGGTFLPARSAAASCKALSTPRANRLEASLGSL